MEKLHTFVEDRHMKIQGVVYNDKLLEKVKKFFNEDYFRHSIQTLNSSEPVTVIRQTSKYSIFYINFDVDFDVKYITDANPGNLPRCILTKNFETIKPNQIGSLQFLNTAGNQIKIKNGDVLVNWKKKLYYVRNGKYYECALKGCGTSLKENKIDRQLLMEITGINNEF